jgi:hypothetical protein
MREEEIIKYLESLLSKNFDWPEARSRDQTASVVTCMDGRLNRFLRPFSDVIRTAGAVAEPVEGSIGIATQVTSITFLATHGDCMAYKQAIEYLATSFAGKIADSNQVRNLNRNDTRPLLTYIAAQVSLGILPHHNDQKALAELAIRYAMQWTSGNTGDKPRVGLFIDIETTLATEPRVWVVSYNDLYGTRLVNFLHSRGMSQQIISTHIFAAEFGKPYRTGTTSDIMSL